MKKFMKALSLLFSLVFVLSLAACGTPASQPPSAVPAAPPAENQTTAPTSAPAEKPLIKIWFHSGDTVMPKYVEANKGDFNVEFTSVPEEEFERKVRVAIAGGTAPDILSVDQPNVASYAYGGAIAPLDEYWVGENLADYSQSEIDSISYNGKKYAVPFVETALVIFYNKKYMAEAGINPPTSIADAWNFEEFLDVAKKLTKFDANGNVEVYGVEPCMGTPDSVGGGMTYSYLYYLHSTGARSISPDGKTATGYFDSEGSKKSLQLFYDLYKNNTAPKQNIPDGFATGKIAMWATGPWMIGTFANFKDLEWGTCPMPADKQYASGMGSWVFTITTQCKDKATAWKLIEKLTSADLISKYCEEFNMLPARKSAKVSFVDQEPFKTIAEGLQKYGVPRPVTPVYPQVSDIICTAFNDVCFGKSVDDVVNQYTAELNKVLAQVQ